MSSSPVAWYSLECLMISWKKCDQSEWIQSQYLESALAHLLQSSPGQQSITLQNNLQLAFLSLTLYIWINRNQGTQGSQIVSSTAKSLPALCKPSSKIVLEVSTVFWNRVYLTLKFWDHGQKSICLQSNLLEAFDTTVTSDGLKKSRRFWGLGCSLVSRRLTCWQSWQWRQRWYGRGAPEETVRGKDFWTSFLTSSGISLKLLQKSENDITLCSWKKVSSIICMSKHHAYT